MKQWCPDPGARDRGGGWLAIDATGVGGAPTAASTGAQANLSKHKAAPKFGGARPRLQREGERAAARRSSSSRRRARCRSSRRSRTTSSGSAARPASRSTIWQNQGQPSQWVQGDERGHRHRRPNAIVLLAGNDPAGAPAPDQAGEGEGNPDDRRAPLRRQPALRAQRRRRRQHPLQDRRPADRRPGDRRTRRGRPTRSS